METLLLLSVSKIEEGDFMPVSSIARRKKTTPRKKGDRRSRASPSYLALVREYPIHPIRSDADLDDAIAVLDGLMARKQLDHQEQDYMESLGHEIERYEQVAYPMPAVSGAAMLRHLMDARQMSLSGVAKRTAIAVSTLSAVLNEKRKLNLTHVKALSAYFEVEPGVFLR